MKQRLYNPVIERLDAGQLRALQERLLRRVLESSMRGSSFWRARLKSAGITDASGVTLEEYRRVEPVTKLDFLRDQEAVPPLGAKSNVSFGELETVMETSGTTGIGQERHALTWSEYEGMAAAFPFQFYWAGVKPGARVALTLPMGMQCGGLLLKRAVEKYGLISFLIAGMNAAQKLNAMRTYQVDALIAVPTYINRLRVVALEMGIDIRRDIPSLKTIFTAAEPYPEYWPQQVADDWGVELSEWYGTTQSAGNHAFTCEQGLTRNDRARPILHNLDHHVLLEVVDSATGLPVKDGQEGEAIITPLFKPDNPVLRFATGDRVRLISRSQCGCGRGTVCIEGGSIVRYDDMMKIRGTNLWPSAVDTVIFGYQEVEEYAGRVAVAESGREEVELSIEFKSDFHGDSKALLRKIEESVHSATGVRMASRRADANSLPRFEFKVRRWTDERRKDRKVVKYLE